MIKHLRWLKVLTFISFFNLLLTQVDNYGIKIKREHRKSHVKHLKWSRSVWLGEPLTSPRFYWNSKSGYVEFKVEANTIGSIEIGFDKEDLIYLWVDDATGKPYLEDYHYGNKTTDRVKDLEDSYYLIGGEQNFTHTEIAFRRPWNTCDKNDAVLGADTVRIRWSIHPHDGIEKDQADISLEESRNAFGVIHGEKSLLLQTPVRPEIPNDPHVHQWDVLMRNVVIRDDMATQYWCKVFKTPPLARKNHIIGYEPMILSNSTALVHHMLLYECDAPPGALDSFSSAHHPGAPCYSHQMPSDWENCVTPVATWVVGGEQKALPDHVGLPIGPRQTYFMLEIHYDNPGLRKVIDNSGLRLFHTEEVRKHDGGVMMTGVTVTPLHLVPPLQTSYRSVGFCNDVCTSKVFPQMGIKIVSVLLHSHLAGRSMRLRHLRGDKEMPRIVEDDKYDFNYQIDRNLHEEVTVFPADQLITECTYNTEDRKNPTFGGYSTREEMCLSFITYYPRTNLASCHSMTPIRSFFKSLGINSFYEVSMEEIEKYVMRTGPMPKLNGTMSTTAFPSFPDSDAAAIAALQNMADFVVEGETEENSLLKLVISEPNEFKDRNLARHLSTLPWGDSFFSKSFESSLARGLQMVFCRLRNDQLAVPPNIESFPNFTEYPPKPMEDCAVSSYLEKSSISRNCVANFFLLLICFVVFRLV